MISIDNLGKAVELQGQLKLWQDALKRCDHGIFKQAHLAVADGGKGRLRVTDAAHGHAGQIAETIIPMEADHVKPLAVAHIARLQGELRELGVEV
jgi:hypothetical protein